MPTKANLERMISKQSDIDKLKYWRDTGIQKLANNARITDFTSEDVAEFTTKINERIVELGGEI